MAVFEVSALLDVVKMIFDFMKDTRDLSKERQEKLINAYDELNNAYLVTDKFIRDNGDIYKDNPKLAAAWGKAAKQVMFIDKGLGEILYYKSRFWNSPQQFRDEDHEVEVITLKEIMTEMGMINQRIR